MQSIYVFFDITKAITILNRVKISSYHTQTCARYSMIVNTIFVWNHLQSCLRNLIFHQLRPNKLKDISYFFPK